MSLCSISGINKTSLLKPYNVNLIQNGSFESPILTSTNYLYTDLTAPQKTAFVWTVSSSVDIYTNVGLYSAPPSGIHFLSTIDWGTSYISQSVVIPSTGNYNLLFLYAKRTSVTFSPIVVTIDGVTVCSVSSPSDFLWHESSTIVALTAGTVLLKFTPEANTGKRSGIDDVRLVKV
jgi:hypothetical protein